MRRFRLAAAIAALALCCAGAQASPWAQAGDAQLRSDIELLANAGVRCERVAYTSSEVIARLGWQHIQAGRTIRPEELEANYIRHSDAEIFSPPRP